MTVPDPDLVARAQRSLVRVADDWLTRPGVLAVEVARRRLDGAPTDDAPPADVGIRVTVERIADVTFPETLDGIPVDVVAGSRPRLEPR